MTNRADQRADSSTRVDVSPGMPTDRVRWGPVLAGTVTALTTLAILGTLGMAIGLSSYDRGHDDARNFMMAGGIWGIISMVLAFGLGGFVAARSSAVHGHGNGLLNGALVAAVGIPLMLFLAGSAATAMSSAELASGRDAQARGQNDNAIVASARIGDTSTNSASTATAEEARRDGSRTAWSTLIAMVLALAAAGIAGRMASRDNQYDSSRTTSTRGDFTPAHT